MEFKDWVVLFLCIALVIAALLFVANIISDAGCRAKTADIGFEHRYSLLGGCQIKVNDYWIPLENWRDWGQK